MTVTVTRSTLFLGYGSLRPFTWLYEAVAEDGTRFDNRSLVELRRVIKKRYGRDVRIVETWK